MAITVTARHMEATSEIQSYAEEKAQRILDDFPRVEHIHVILDAEKHRRLAEFVVQAKNRIRVEAEESSGDLTASIDSAVEKVERQLRKLRDRVQEHRVRGKRADSTSAVEEST